MMEVEAHVFYWTKDGMRIQAPLPHAVGYVQRGEVELLLEAAHRRGRNAGLEEAQAIMRRT